MNDSERQHIIDEEHLKLLRIGYIVFGATAALGILFGLVYVVLGISFASGSFDQMQQRPGASALPPGFMGWVFGGVGGCLVILAGGFAALCLSTARALRLRRSRTLCLITAAVVCLSIPFGTMLGIFTFTVLGRPTVEKMFEPGRQLPAVL